MACSLGDMVHSAAGQVHLSLACSGQRVPSLCVCARRGVYVCVCVCVCGHNEKRNIACRYLHTAFEIILFEAAQIYVVGRILAVSLMYVHHVPCMYSKMLVNKDM